MASQNNQSNGAGAAMGIVAAGMLVFFYVFVIVICILSFVCTILSLIAWFRPLKLGRWGVTPTEARWFIYGGIIGAYLFPMFAEFFLLLIELSIPVKYWDYANVVGYILGSFAGTLIYEEIKEPEPPARLEIEPTYIKRTPPPPAPKPFEFASWDDEEESR